MRGLVVGWAVRGLVVGWAVRGAGLAIGAGIVILLAGPRHQRGSTGASGREEEHQEQLPPPGWMCRPLVTELQYA